MNLPSQGEIVGLLTRCVVPLFILFNIVGWLGLRQREANRAHPALTEQNLSDLGRALWAAWLAGVLGGLIVLSAIFRIWAPLLQNTTITFRAVGVAGVIGAVLGVARGVLPVLRRFRTRSAVTQRRILSALVICAVAASLASGMLYYNSQSLLRSVIASAFACMCFGYVVSLVFQL
jgi:hypothetical protein